MSGFGDFDDDDAFDPNEPPDGEQVARRIHALRLERGLEAVTFDELDADRQTMLIVVAVILIAWLRREGGIR